MTVEERARDYACHVSIDELNREGLDSESFCGILHGYIQGATEQREIDIDKACEVYRNELEEIINLFDRIGEQFDVRDLGKTIALEGSVKDFRKAMEE